MIRGFGLGVLVITTVGFPGMAGEAQVVPFDAESWVVNAREHRVEEHLGRQSLFLKGGIAWLDEVELEDGVIEFELSFSGERGFVGGIWRMMDAGNYEEFYVRPHQSGKPDANQYTPIFNGAAGWQLYHGEGYSAPVSYRTEAWLTVRIVFSGNRAEVYIDDLTNPAVPIHELKHGARKGKIGVMAGNFAPAWFSEFRYRTLDPGETLGSMPVAPSPAEPGTVPVWEVSSAFAESTVAGKTTLSAEHKAGLTWTVLEAESTGITNLARVQGVAREADTVFARVVMNAEAERTVRFRFGYSDRVHAYLNDRLIYAGDNTYRSRDYRYLGTIGLFDAIQLPLRKGRNELWLAVSESFGGWGVLGVVDEQPGVRLEAP